MCYSVCWRLWRVGSVCSRLLELLVLPEVMGGVLRCLLEVLEAPEVMLSVLLCLLEAPEVMRCVLLCILEVIALMVGSVVGFRNSYGGSFLVMVSHRRASRNLSVGTWMCLPQEIWNLGGMLRALIYKRSGDALQACCLYLPQEPRSSSGALLALPLFASRALELRRHAVGVLPLRGMETGCERADVVM